MFTVLQPYFGTPSQHPEASRKSRNITRLARWQKGVVNDTAINTQTAKITELDNNHNFNRFLINSKSQFLDKQTVNELKYRFEKRELVEQII